tara:strand:+ start:16824 stop:17228 length:405 start_codon:yes stop_codon:yes gene_type:complete
MVEIECPHCDEGIELNDNEFGLFECPFCEEDFEWNSEGTESHEVLFGTGEFWIGTLVPFLTTILGVIASAVIFDDAWDSLGWMLISILLWPIVAIGIGIYGFVSMRKRLLFGSTISLMISVVLFLLVLVVFAFS